jgi:energy-coupling factor transporter ATP-binding protein EcfA2
VSTNLAQTNRKSLLRILGRTVGLREYASLPQNRQQALQAPSETSGPKNFYELRSINLWGMKETEQVRVLEGYIQFLNALTEPTTLRIIEDSRNVRAGASVYENARFKRYIIETSASSQIDGAVSMIGAKFEKITSIPQPKIARVFSRYLVDDSGNFVQVSNVTRLGGRLPMGFICQVYGIAHEVRIEIDPINDLFKAKRMVNERLSSLCDSIAFRRSKSWLVGADLISQKERLEKIANELSSSLQRLFRLRIKFVLRAKSLEALLGQRKLLRQALSSYIEELDSPSFVQLPLYNGGGPGLSTGRWFFVPTETLGAFFPFAGLDLVDSDGTLLGQNLLTRNVVVYDVYEKDNYNIALIGSTGSGKSTLIKSWVSRIAQENPEMVLFTFDALDKREYSSGPDGSFESSFAAKTGSSPYFFRQNEKAGLDPFKIFLEEEEQRTTNKPDVKTVSELLSMLLNESREPEIRTEFRLACEKSASIGELFDNSSEDLRKQLRADLGPYMFLFQGDPIPLDSRTCFVLSSLPDWAKDLAQFLAFSYSWQVISRIPKKRKKMVVVDEGWRLISPVSSGGSGRTLSGSSQRFNVASTYVPKIARTGRHYNCAFILATQLARDFFSDNSVGRPMIESCATKIVLKQDEAASDLLSGELSLSSEEQRFIQRCSQGQGLLLTSEGRIQFYNMLSESERNSFTTRPKEMKT